MDVTGMLIDCQWSVNGESLESHSIATGMPIDYQWNVTQLSMECQLTVNGVSLNCHQLTFQWHSSDSPVEVECHLSVTRICLFVYLSVYLFVCLFKWHSSGIQWYSSDIPVALEWHSIGSVSFKLSDIPVAVKWHSSDRPRISINR